VNPGVPEFIKLMDGEGKADKLEVCEADIVAMDDVDSVLVAETAGEAVMEPDALGHIEASEDKVVVLDALGHIVPDTVLDAETVCVGETE
jgi:hypothetical protein